MIQKIDRLQLPSFGNLELLAKQIVEGFLTGLHQSPFHGFSVEFAEHRLYNQGESTRHIDWKLYAKTDKFFLKRYEEETNLRCQLVIDVSGSMFFPKDEEINKLNFSIIAAAALSELLKKQRDAIGLSLISNKIHFHSEAKLAVSHHHLIYNEMENYLHNFNPNQDQKETNLIETIHTLSEITHRRSVIILFSDFLQFHEDQHELIQALQHLKHNKHEVILFHVTDVEKEINFNFSNNLHTFIDMETGEELKLSPIEIKSKYKESISKYISDLKEDCHQLKIDFFAVDIKEEIENVLLNFLLKRK